MEDPRIVKMTLNLNEYIFNIKTPCVFKKILEFDGKSNSVFKWTPSFLINIFKDEKLTFRIGKKSLSENCKYIIIVYIGKKLNFQNKDHRISTKTEVVLVLIHRKKFIAHKS